MKKFRRPQKIFFHPIMTYVLLMIGMIVLSGLLKLLDAQATHYVVNDVTFELLPKTETITSLFSLSGIKYVFTNTVANFARFKVLPNLLIFLMGISILDKSGFLQTAITLATKTLKKKAVTFIFVFLCVVSSIIGDLSYIIFIPLGALLFYYGKRNPAIGIIAAYASLACGSGISFIFTSVDSDLLSYTNLSVKSLNSNYVIGVLSFVFIMLASVIVISYLITMITENIIAKKLPKYEFTEAELEEDIVTKDEKKGMKYAGIAAFIYLAIVIYNIIPGLPLSGALLDRNQSLYIDKLFNASSFFSNGFVFIVTMLFIILGLFYGIGVKTIKSQKDFCDYLGHSLDGIGNVLVMIFLASTFISIFNKTNIGNFVVSFIGDIIKNSNFTGVPLIILVFLGVGISTLFLPGTQAKWYILSTSIVPSMMNAEMSPAFAQIVYRFSECVTMNITPLLGYFIIYLAFLEKYNQGEQKIGLFTSIKYQASYTLLIAASLFAILVIWYIIGLPLGINSFPTI